MELASSTSPPPRRRVNRVERSTGELLNVCNFAIEEHLFPVSVEVDREHFEYSCIALHRYLRDIDTFVGSKRTRMAGAATGGGGKAGLLSGLMVSRSYSFVQNRHLPVNRRQAVLNSSTLQPEPSTRSPSKRMRRSCLRTALCWRTATLVTASVATRNPSTWFF